MFRIVFISYQEPNADENWAKLKHRFPEALRAHGIVGIHNAHKASASNLLHYRDYLKSLIIENPTSTPAFDHYNYSHFWVVDGDSVVADDFNFEVPDDLWDDAVYVYRAENPVNGLSYGYGGIKLLPVEATAQMPLGNVDMTTSISNHFFPVDRIASITNFNTDPFNTWKSAFRECVKLSSKVIDGQVDTETEHRLDVWCNTINDEVPNAVWAMEGARDGKEYGAGNKNNTEALKNINNFDWLKNKFKELYDQEIILQN